jgi:hypothetical protein
MAAMAAIHVTESVRRAISFCSVASWVCARASWLCSLARRLCSSLDAISRCLSSSSARASQRVASAIICWGRLPPLYSITGTRWRRICNQHALINPRGNDSTTSSWKTDPAYIHPDHFAAAFLEILKRGATINPAQTIDDLKGAVKAALPDGTNDQIRTMVNGMIDRAAGDEEKIRAELSAWFDSSMDRVAAPTNAGRRCGRSYSL